MAKSETIDSILDCAIKAFAQWGFEGASLRQIAAQAAVSLSAIDMYFGSKKDLYIASQMKVWDEISEERSELIRQAMAQHAGQPVTLREFFTALAYPILRRVMSDSESVTAQVHFIQSRINEHQAVGSKLVNTADRQVALLIDTMAQVCPGLSRNDLIWAFSYGIGVIYSWQLIYHRYDGLLTQDRERSLDSLLNDVVSFCCGGVQALIEQRTASVAGGAGQKP